MKLQIQRATPEDMPTIASFIRSTADWYEPFLNPKDMAEHKVGHQWIKENYKKRNFYIARTHQEDIGTISTQFFGDVAYLGYIYLDAQQAGKGYGSKLIDHAKEICMKKPGINKMVLISHPKAIWAVKAYKKYGFKVIKTKKEDILKYNNGFLNDYYEEGFHLFEYLL